MLQPDIDTHIYIQSVLYTTCICANRVNLPCAKAMVRLANQRSGLRGPHECDSMAAGQDAGNPSMDPVGHRCRAWHGWTAAAGGEAQTGPHQQETGWEEVPEPEAGAPGRCGLEHHGVSQPIPGALIACSSTCTPPPPPPALPWDDDDDGGSTEDDAEQEVEWVD